MGNLEFIISLRRCGRGSHCQDRAGEKNYRLNISFLLPFLPRIVEIREGRSLFTFAICLIAKFVSVFNKFPFITNTDKVIYFLTCTKRIH